MREQPPGFCIAHGAEICPRIIFDVKLSSSEECVHRHRII